jgi:hypothetical protein
MVSRLYKVSISFLLSLSAVSSKYNVEIKKTGLVSQSGQVMINYEKTLTSLVNCVYTTLLRTQYSLLMLLIISGLMLNFYECSLFFD